MTKVREAGSCAEALWMLVSAIGRTVLGERASESARRSEGIVQIGQTLGVSEGVVRNMLDPDQPEQLSLERAGLLARVYGVDLLARWLAVQASGTFIPLPSPTGDIERLTAKGVRAAGETAARVIEAQSDQSDAGASISEGEARQLAKDCRFVVETFGEMAVLADRAVRAAQREAKR